MSELAYENLILSINISYSIRKVQRLFFLKSSTSTPTFNRKRHWLLLVDYNSNFIWSLFLKEKSNILHIMPGLIKNLKNKYYLQVQYLCFNNAGENVAFERACKQKELDDDYKYTGPGMPQQNGHIKPKFASLFNLVHSVFNGGKFHAYLQKCLRAKAANTVTLLEKIMISLNKNLSPFQQFFGKEREASCLLCKNLVKCV